MPLRCPVISEWTVFTIFSCAWYMIAEPGMTRCETIRRPALPIGIFPFAALVSDNPVPVGVSFLLSSEIGETVQEVAHPIPPSACMVEGAASHAPALKARCFPLRSKIGQVVCQHGGRPF